MINLTRTGIGVLLYHSFEIYRPQLEAAFQHDSARSPLMLLADFSGEHSGSSFQTYGFLAAKAGTLRAFQQRTQHLRATSGLRARRVSYKALNDKVRRQALPTFLDAMSGIQGCLLTFTVPRALGNLFPDGRGQGDEQNMLMRWKPSQREKLLRVLHVLSYLSAALTYEGQDVLCFIDEDNIVASNNHLKEFTNLLARLASRYADHDLGHLRVGTARNDPDDRQIEDLLSVPDLVAGAIRETASSMMWNSTEGKYSMWVRPSDAMPWKTHKILRWWLEEDALTKLSVLVLPGQSPEKLSILSLRNEFHLALTRPPK